MARKPNNTDFVINVPKIGAFTFGRRTMRDEIDIQVEYARILNGVEATQWLAVVGGWMSVFKVMTVHAPEGWDIETMDPMDPDTYQKMGEVYDLLSEKERFFRGSSKIPSTGAGQPAVQDI